MCFHQQDLGYKGFIANIIICEKSILTCDGIPSTTYSLVCKNRQIKHGGAIEAKLHIYFFVPRRTFSRKKFGASKNSGTVGGQT